MTSERTRNGLLALLPVLLLGAHAWLRWGPIGAELELYACYASSLAGGHGFALQPGAVQSSGVAAPLWVVLLAGGAAVGAELDLLARLAGLALGALFIWSLPGLSLALSGRARLTALDLLPALGLAASGLLAETLVSGDETGLFLLLLALTLRLFLAEEGRFMAGARRPGDLASLLPAAALLGCRPEAPLLLGGLLCWRLLARLTAGRAPWSSIVWLLTLPTLYILSLVGSYALFADLWPGVITARDALWDTRVGSTQAVAATWRDLSRSLFFGGAVGPLLLAAVIGAGRAVNYWGRTALVALAGASLAGMLLFTGADHGRLALPLLLALLLLAAEGLEAVIRRLWAPGTTLRRLGGLALALGLVGPLAVNSAAALGSHPHPGLGQTRALLHEVRSTVRDLGWEPRAVSVLTTSPGTAARLGFRVIDASGLTDPSLRRYAGNRRPHELQQLIFSEHRPDVIVEQGPWRSVHNLQRYPEARRLYIPLSPRTRIRARVSLARRLVMEYEPWPEQHLRVPLGQGLELLGMRVEPGHLVLLLTVTRKVAAPITLSLAVGQEFVDGATVGPRIYPVTRWRPGELVRMRVPLSDMFALADQLIEVGVGNYDPTARLDLRPLKQTRQAWQRALERRHGESADWDLSEAIAMLCRRQRQQGDPLTDRALQRIKKLQDKGLLLPAIRQLEAARRAYAGQDGLEALARSLASEAYVTSMEHIRASRWTSAFALLRAASRADPASPWIARRLSEARRRMPAGSHLVEELELELARRALVLAPTTSNLERVLGAQMTLGRYPMVVAVAHTWKHRVDPSRRSQYLLAKALAKVGRLADAQSLLNQLLGNPAQSKLVRRCPDGVWPELLLLQAEVLQLQGSDEPGAAPGARFKGRARPVGQHSQLFSYCARWKPGRSLEVDLYIWHAEPEALSLTLNVGSRMDRLVLAKSSQRVRLVRRSYKLPPAAYPVRLQGEGSAPISLDTVEVGPEITFGFELPGYPGWTNEGTAFGRTPVVGRSFRARKLFGYVGERFADSYHQVSDRSRGRLISPLFKVRRSHLMLLLAGGAGEKLGVDLQVEGKTVATVRGKRSETLRLVMLPLARHRGKMARVVIRDRAVGKWGHLAVDEIRQINGPMPGVAP